MGAAQTAQAISTIAKAACEAEATLPDDSVSSTSATAPSPIDTHAEALKRLSKRLGGQTAGEPFAAAIFDASSGPRQSTVLVPELSSPAPLGAPAIADVANPRMAPGIGGFNIDAPMPSADPVKPDLAIDDVRGRLLLEPELVRPLPILSRRNAIVEGEESSLVFNLLMIIAVAGITLAAFGGEAVKQVLEWPRDLIRLHEDRSATRTLAHPALVVTESQKGFANEPLPLGISLKDATGEETATISGLAEGTDLSLGSSQGAVGWLLSARDLDRTFVGPPKDFVGVMDAEVILSSADGRVLESQVIRLEWIAKKEAGLSLASAERTPVVPRRDTEQTDAVLPSPNARQTTPVVPSRTVAQRALAVPSRTADQTATVAPSRNAGQAAPVVPTRNADQAAAAVPSRNVDQTAAAVPVPNAEQTAAVAPSLNSEEIVTATVAPSPNAGQTAPVVPTRNADQAAAAVPSLDSEEIVALVKLAEDLLPRDIATARLLLKCAALAGNAQAAFELGMTFDQDFLTLSGIPAVPPDAAQAREWYERAIRLGLTEASRHLERLAIMPK